MTAKKQNPADLFQPQQFPSYIDVDSHCVTSKPTDDGYYVRVRIERDKGQESPEKHSDGFWPSLDPESAGYIGKKSKKTLANHMNHARRVMATWYAGEWCYVGVVVTVWKTWTPTGEPMQLSEEYDNAVWSCDCNYPSMKQGRTNIGRNYYLASIANDLAREALAKVREQHKRETLDEPGKYLRPAERNYLQQCATTLGDVREWLNTGKINGVGYDEESAAEFIANQLKILKIECGIEPAPDEEAEAIAPGAGHAPAAGLPCKTAAGG